MIAWFLFLVILIGLPYWLWVTLGPVLAILLFACCACLLAWAWRSA